MSPRPRAYVPVLVFVVGMASLGAEIAAARLLAPYFGASTIVWANTIATVLLALSIGYWFGGRLADRRPDATGLSALVLVAAGLLAAVPFAAGPFLDVSVEALESISAGAFLGSLVGVLVLVAVPVLLLGAAAPYAIRLSVTRLEDTGRIAGRLYAISTVGSLTGTFLSALLLIPLVGTRRTFLLFALALAVAALPGLARRWAVVPAVVVGLIVLPVGTVKAELDPGDRVIHEAETEYQYARVIEAPDGTRRLELNEGQAIHSLLRPGSYLTGDYWDGFLVLPRAVLGGEPARVAMLGNAGGTVARAYGHFLPRTLVDAVEIDGEVTEIGRRYFDLRGPRLRLHTADARPWLRRSDGRFDAIFVDAYRQPYIPFYLATREFFELCRDRLRPGGVVIVNVGHPETSDRLEKVLSATMGDVFAHVWRDPTEPTNSLVMASDAAVSPERLRRAAGSLPPELRTEALAAATRLEPGLRGGRVYTDDVAPVEWLIDTAILDYAAGE